MDQEELLRELAAWSMRLDQKASSLETLGYLVFMTGMMAIRRALRGGVLTDREGKREQG